MLRIFFWHLYDFARLCLSLVIFLPFFFWSSPVFAAEPPNLISPVDGESTGKSPKLNWEYKGECIDSGYCFKLEVDNAENFPDPEKSPYTNSSSYSPQGLKEGTWYWRVKARDKSEKWSDWSKVFKFTLGLSGNPSSSPTPAASSSNTQPISSKTENKFEIKDVPSEINSDQEFEVSISLSEKPEKTFYLKSAFKKDGSSNYFGETFYNGEWIKNGSSYSKQFKITTDSSGKWEGKIKVRPDEEDSGFDGSGEYILKFGKYSESGSGPSWSNEVNLKINQVLGEEPSPSPEDEEIEEEEEIEAEKIPYPSRNYEIKIASVAGEATMSNNMPLVTLEEHTRVLQEKKINWLLIILGCGILVGGIGFGAYKVSSQRSGNR